MRERFLEAITRDDKPRKTGLHVTDLTRDCLRQTWYEKHLGAFNNPSTMLSFWKGRKLHETPILKEHELELEWNGILGTIDQYEDGTLLDLKTTTAKFFPDKLPEPYRRQLEYYTVLLQRNGYPVQTAQVLFFNLVDNQTRLFTLDKTRERTDVEKEMLERKTILEQSEPPDRNLEDQYCNFCPYGLQCFK
jgi:CRISPR/Cas system-associated exonuclease Cas4 (RecB family)